jgi:hypothetical protein
MAATKFRVPDGLQADASVVISPTSVPHIEMTPLASDPGTLTEGDLWVHDTSGLSFHTGAATKRIAYADMSNLSGTLPIANGGTGAATTSQNFAFVGPTSGSGAPLFRALVAGDIPTLTAAKISDFDTQVRTSRLDQMAAPTASVAMGSQRITGLADPTSAQDAATKAYVDAISVGLDPKGSVRLVATTNLDLSGNETIDGVLTTNGDRVLVVGQSTASQNGIWLANSSLWTRTSDADTSAKVTAGMYVFVEEGTTYADTGWVLTTNNPITLGTTALVFTQFTGAGQITAGAGLTKTGNTIDAVGTAGRISVAADAIDIDAAYVGQASITTLGTVATGTWNATAIAANKGGTGQTAYTIGDILFASSASALSKLAAVATGSALISGGVGAAPSWGKVGLATHVSGTLGVTNGGTGLTAVAAGDILYASALNTIAALAKGTANQVLGMNNGATAPEYKTISGTASQVVVTHGTGSVTLSTPQNIATNSNVTFASVTASTSVNTDAVTLKDPDGDATSQSVDGSAYVRNFAIYNPSGTVSKLVEIGAGGANAVRITAYYRSAANPTTNVTATMYIVAIGNTTVDHQEFGRLDVGTGGMANISSVTFTNNSGNVRMTVNCTGLVYATFLVEQLSIANIGA